MTNFKKIKFIMKEFISGFADAPLFFSIFVPLVSICNLNPKISLFLFGLSFIFASLFFKIPISVQPLKSIATVSIIYNIPSEYINFAGLVFGFIFLIFFIFSEKIEKNINFIPSYIVGGIQISIAILLIKTGINFIFPQSFRIEELYFIFFLIFVLIFLCKKSPHFSLSLILFCGFLQNILYGMPEKGFIIGRSLDVFNIKKILFLLILPQIPLTLTNSTIATIETAKYYFDKRAKRVNYKNIFFSIGFLNILNGLLKGIPICHGATGLVSYSKFGAKTYLSTLFFGIVLMFLSFFPWKIIKIFYFSDSILGILLFYIGLSFYFVGIERAKNNLEFFVLFIMSLITILTNNIGFGFLISIIISIILKKYGRNFS
jgi:MFS superfamily sulfate permease-like transporter